MPVQARNRKKGVRPRSTCSAPGRRRAPRGADERMRALFAVEGVSKIFPRVRALKRRLFEFVPGEVHALMGETMAA
jgi:hypothetical protein